MSSVSDVLVACVLAVLLIVGGYQVYFLPQRWPLRAPRRLLLALDDKIPFWPQWVWAYSLLYYPFILSIIPTIRDFRHYAYTAANFAILLLTQVVIAYALPVKTPKRWRRYERGQSLSTKFLGFVQSVDSGGNCFPSMHIAVASLAALHIANNMSDYGPLIPVLVVLTVFLIFLSALFTKQHYLLDVPAGLMLGIAIYSIHPLLYRV
ncbi:MAG TPA: phosphatase PAP2 family protein [Allosphingosinicella sp.]|nr:phosphatase PAP2 family protein [Allosphingosinicella sp.]